ncbi:MAG TPA: hypothetical protein VLG17_16915 [Pseudomonas sp.]|uniref:hypothetical protein n=1 Tax=Pseudomonas sp. TaxID=306 RepID=UPI002D0C970E|nr:hypothetical protein [Pseudomonas sp.]HSX89658.1 hypothetical protein [Pseudomonas sp.]
MSGYVGLREDAQLGHSLALRIAALFPLRCRSVWRAGKTRGLPAAGGERRTQGSA